MKPLLSALRGDIGIITMNNDSHRNVLSEAFFEQLTAVLDAFRESRVRAVILRANAGARVWSAGHDVNELPPAGQDPLCWTEILPSMTRALHNFPAPVIAMIEGTVWGGACELALACDIVVAATGTTFALTPARLGVPYNINGLSTFTRSLTPQLLKELLFTAAPMPAERLASAGAINHVVPTAALESFCFKSGRTDTGECTAHDSCHERNDECIARRTGYVGSRIRATGRTAQRGLQQCGLC